MLCLAGAQAPTPSQVPESLAPGMGLGGCDLCPCSSWALCLLSAPNTGNISSRHRQFHSTSSRAAYLVILDSVVNGKVCLNVKVRDGN